jgi:hypothetical protein
MPRATAKPPPGRLRSGRCRDRGPHGSRPANGARGGSSGRPVVVRWRSKWRAGTRNAWRQAREVAAHRGRSGQLGAQLYRHRRVAALHDAHFGARRGRRFVGYSCPLLSGYFGRVAMRSNARRSATYRPSRMVSNARQAAAASSRQSRRALNARTTRLAATVAHVLVRLMGRFRPSNPARM